MIPDGAAFVFQNLQGKLKTLRGRLSIPRFSFHIWWWDRIYRGIFGDFVAAPVGREFVAALAHLFKPFVRNSRVCCRFSPSPLPTESSFFIIPVPCAQVAGLVRVASAGRQAGGKPAETLQQGPFLHCWATLFSPENENLCLLWTEKIIYLLSLRD